MEGKAKANFNVSLLLNAEIYQWMVSRIAMSPVLITNKEELQIQLDQTPELFCYCLGNQQ
jgi:hypothetical protein